MKNEQQQNDTGQYINDRIAAIQQRIAGFLGSKMAHWTPAKILVVLILFCALDGAWCLWVMSRAFIHLKGPPGKPVSNRQLHIPIPGQVEPDSARLNFLKQSKINQDGKQDNK